MSVSTIGYSAFAIASLSNDGMTLLCQSTTPIILARRPPSVAELAYFVTSAMDRSAVSFTTARPSTTFSIILYAASPSHSLGSRASHSSSPDCRRSNINHERGPTNDASRMSWEFSSSSLLLWNSGCPGRKSAGLFAPKSACASEALTSLSSVTSKRASGISSCVRYHWCRLIDAFTWDATTWS